ncbi:acyl-CoA dehydrogenase family protein, partial [Sphingomonas adhaesiva]
MADRTFLDWPFFDDGHRRLADDLDAWCAAELSHHHGDDVDAECRALVAKLGRAGWLRYCVPAAYGGVHEQLDVRSLSLIRETLARHSGLADFAFAMQGLGTGTISLFGTEEQKARYLPPVARGERIAAFALTEPGSGSDAAAMTTTAEPHGDGWRVNGAKTYISNGGIANHYVLFARTGYAPGAKGVSAFIVDADARGLEVAERIDVLAPHPLATLHFRDMVLPGDALLGERGRGFAEAMATLDVFRTTVGAASLGFARRALDEATA